MRTPQTLRTLWTCVVLLSTAFALPISIAAEPSPVVLRVGSVSVEVEVREGRLIERYLALEGGAWVEAAVADRGSTAGPVSVVGADGTPLAGSARRVSLEGRTLVEDIAAGGHRIVRTVTVVGDGPWVRVVTRLEPSGRAALRRFFDGYRFSRRPDWSYSPSVGGFNPDAQHKAPLILVQAERVALGIVPDLATLDREALRRCNHALDLDVPAGPMLGVGFVPARLAYHSVYGPDPERTWTAEDPVENAYYLLVRADAPPGAAFRSAVRFHWETFGRAEQMRAADQQVGTGLAFRSLRLFDDWREEVWARQSRGLWLPVILPDGSTGGAVRTRRWGPGPSVYLSSWFNGLRTSYGMALHARRPATPSFPTSALRVG